MSNAPITYARIVARLQERPYGYDRTAARKYAQRILDTKSDGWIAVFLQDLQGCSNCGEPATSGGRGAAWRCDACEVLPSDYL